MDPRKNLEKKYALISVFDKSKLKYLCSSLDQHNYTFISSGSTGDRIRSMGFKCINISTNIILYLDKTAYIEYAIKFMINKK